MTGAIRRHRACLIACGGLMAMLAAAPPVHAAPGRIVLLQPPTASAGARRCLTLIRDELVAGGFVVAAVDLGPAQDPVSLAGAMRRQQGAVATIGLLGDPSSGPAELWILDNIGGNAEVRRIPAPSDDPERVAEVLAIRTVEVLRASALKLLIESSRAPAAPAPAAQITAAPSPAASPAAPRTVAIETGLSLLVSPGQLDPAAVPLARLRVAVAGPAVARLTIAGFGTRPSVETARGAASIAQALGLVEIGLVFRRDSRVQPLLSLGAGALRASSDAQGAFPYLGQRDARWAALFDAGAGVLTPLGGQLALALEAHVMLAAPYPVVRFAELDAATIARPAAWTTLTLVAWL